MGDWQSALEDMAMKLFDNAFAGTPTLVTGHTGFKGSWLVSWLHELGADVSGLALPPETEPNHWRLLGAPIPEQTVDIRDAAATLDALRASRPKIVFHLAAQALVRRSYREPLTTWQTNVLGTANILEACRQTESVQAVVVITTDKVYANQEWDWGYRENDRLGGHDPYSASKACCELLTDSFRNAFFSAERQILVATARAGNVIGGGDWSEDRLIPDLVRAVAGDRELEIRCPTATRPWQHVLECLSGYLMLGQRLLARQDFAAAAWNFGPDALDNRTVLEVLVALQKHWPEVRWRANSQPQPHEASLLYLDNAKSKAQLGWRPVWSLSKAIEMTARWYQTFAGGGALDTLPQLRAFIQSATESQCIWTRS